MNDKEFLDYISKNAVRLGELDANSLSFECKILDQMKKCEVQITKKNGGMNHETRKSANLAKVHLIH